MKILYIVSTPIEYSSSANIRNVALIYGLINLGYQVSILAARPDENDLYYDKSINKLNIIKRYYLEISSTHAKFISKKENEKNNFKSRFKKNIKKNVYRLYNAVSIYDPRKKLTSEINNLTINETFDLIISSSDPKSSHLIAEKLIQRTPQISKMWLQYWGDPFTIDINNKSLIPRRLIKKEEYRILKKADKIIYVSPFTLEKQKQMFPLIKEKFSFLPIPYLKNNKNKIEEKEIENKSIKIFKLGYFGDYFSKDRNISPLYEAVSILGDNLLICGNSNLEIKKLKNIQINPRVNLEQVNIFEKECDLLICLCNKNSTQIPGKVYHYAGTEKPILIILDGEYKNELREYFQQFNRYFLCENNVDSINKAIREIKCSKLQFVPSPFFAPDRIAQEIIKLIKNPTSPNEYKWSE
ncbi:hypothetical protein MHH33_14445 [Paenisporosarcina sp. FSL H8-0542]|uniref:hypothetical protein n=1 Tax=Paenisporosarcina sp. FSL H8-0542 TaxID=2921401 RepID=UPI00315AE2F3